MAATANGSFPDLPDTDTSSEMGDWPTLNEQDREARDVMIHDIRSLYDGGVPLYTKDQIRQMAHQFDRYVAGELEDDTAVLVGINGVEVTQLIFDPTRDGSTEKRKPFIGYQSIQSLTDWATLRNWHDPSTGYLSLWICFAGQVLNHDGVVIDTSVCCFSCDDLVQLFDESMEKWKVTEQHQTLQATFASTPGLSKARKVIGLALGGLVHGPEVSERSFLQYALLLSLREFISKGGRSNSSESADEVACFAQDPMLFPTAVEALGSAGITVLDDPEAFLEIDDTTLVLSIAPNVPVKQIVTEIARPAAIVWCKGSLLRDGESPMQV